MDDRRTRGWLAIAVALFALAAGACSGGDGGGGGPLAGGNANEDAGEVDGGDAGDSAEGDDDGSGGDARGDGCELVTADDAEAILGEPVVEDEDSSADAFATASCFWTVEGETSFKLLQFSVSEGRQFYGGDLFKDEESFEPVDGLGDEAFFTDLAGTALQVRDGDTVVFLTVSDFNTESPLDRDQLKVQLKDLAAKVLDRL